MEDFIKFLRVFVESHLTPTICSIAISLFIIVLLPSDYWMISKIGEDWFKIFVFSTVFIIIKLCTFFVKQTKTSISNRIFKRKEKTRKEQEAKESWEDAFNHLTKEEISLIKELVNNKNKPVIKKDGVGIIDRSNYLHRINRNTNSYLNDAYEDYQDDIFICKVNFEEDPKSKNNRVVHIYKLQENAYNAAKLFIESEGRLSIYDEFDD